MDQNVVASPDDLCSQMDDTDQHQLRNRSVTKRDIKLEQKQQRLEKKQLKEKSKSSVFSFVQYIMVFLLVALLVYTFYIKPSMNPLK